MPHNRVLICNRGEIAIRIAKAASAMGLESVSVYPSADRFSLHTTVTTSAEELDAAPAAPAADPVAAYLDIEAMIDVAKRTGCDLVHPGYGFLAENPGFARRCAEEGLTFVGPPPEALALFGDKVRARVLATSLAIPVISGSAEALATADDAAIEAERVGYPVMLKAAAGGGGRGMRVVEAAAEMDEAFARCTSEAEAGFGDGTLFLERLVGRPRHIEVQILADGTGNVVHLHERDCSVQQRNQKMVEIAPAAGLDPVLRHRILDDAVRLIAATEFMAAGTVEFLVSPETGEHFFIECNPRIQVEHTITEQVTGIDLVAAQFHLAGGGSLADLGLADQEAVPEPRGFAVQARVVATGPGTITAYKEPSGPGVRVDGSGYAGYAPPPQFDPLLAKVIGSSGFVATLDAALQRTLHALDEFHIAGMPTNLAQLRAILANGEVRAGNARTTLLAEHPELAGGSAVARSGNGSGRTTVRANTMLSLLDERAGALVGAAGSTPGPIGSGTAGPGGGAVNGGRSLEVAPGRHGVTCPMAAALLERRVDVGDEVAAGDTIVIVHAMKMETNVTAPVGGTITDLLDAGVGDAVGADQVIAVIAPGPGRGDGARNGATGDEQEIRPEDGWQPTLDDVHTLHRLAEDRLAPDSEEPGVVRQRSRGKLNCRRAHRPAARRWHLPRGRQRRRLRLLRRGRQHLGLHARQPRRRLG